MTQLDLDATIAELRRLLAGGETFGKWRNRVKIINLLGNYLPAILDALEAAQREIARLRELSEQWETGWKSHGEAHAAGYNEAADEIARLRAELAKYQELTKLHIELDPSKKRRCGDA